MSGASRTELRPSPLSPPPTISGVLSFRSYLCPYATRAGRCLEICGHDLQELAVECKALPDGSEFQFEPYTEAGARQSPSGAGRDCFTSTSRPAVVDRCRSTSASWSGTERRAGPPRPAWQLHSQRGEWVSSLDQEFVEVRPAEQRSQAHRNPLQAGPGRSLRGAVPGRRHRRAARPRPAPDIEGGDTPARVSPLSAAGLHLSTPLSARHALVLLQLLQTPARAAGVHSSRIGWRIPR